MNRILLATLIIGSRSFCLGQETDVLVLNSGETISGVLTGMNGGFISVAQTAGTGNIERRFSPGNVLEFRFSDGAAKSQAVDLHLKQNHIQAIPLLEAITRKRAPYLGLLNKVDTILFSYLAKSYRLAERSSDALDRIKIWKRKIDDQDILAELNETAMLAAWSLGHYDEAKLLAEEWIEEGWTSRRTAVAWRILANWELKNGEPESALWIALQPIVFATQQPIRELDYCFALSTVAALRIERTAHALELYKDMQDRELGWPIELPGFNESLRTSQKTTLAPEKPSPIEPSAAIYSELPFDSVPKLRGQP